MVSLLDPQHDLPSSGDALMYNINPVIAKLSQLDIVAIMMNQIEDKNIPDLVPTNTFMSMERHRKLDANSSGDNWGIEPLKAKATLHATTQRFKRSAILPIGRRYWVDRFYKVKRLDAKFSTDTMWADIKSLNHHKYAQIFSQKCGFVAAYPIDKMTGDQIGRALQDFIHDFGVPESLTFHGHKSQTGKDSLFMHTIRKYHIHYHISAPRRPEQIPAQ